MGLLRSGEPDSIQNDLANAIYVEDIELVCEFRDAPNVDELRRAAIAVQIGGVRAREGRNFSRRSHDANGGAVGDVREVRGLIDDQRVRSFELCGCSLLSGRLVQVRRPEKFFRETGEMPEHVEHTFQIPSDAQRIGDVEEFLNDLREFVARREAEIARSRAEEGRFVLGRRGVLRQSWRDSPTSHEPRRGLRPRVAAGSEWSRRQALQRNRVFIDAYRAARKLWLAGMEAIFPRGTYWLCRFARIQVADAIAVPIISN